MGGGGGKTTAATTVEGGTHTQIAGVAQKGRAKIKSKQNTMKTTNGT